MAGASMNDIKSRLKSVRSTMQITKAMELVATSKLRRAKERAESSRVYSEVLKKSITGIEAISETELPIWHERGAGKTLFIVIAGDRGLAGGYNANIFRLAEALARDKDAIYLPIGKKALEYYRHRNKDIYSSALSEVADVGVGAALNISSLITESFVNGEIGSVVLVYTKFASMISQIPMHEELLPFGMPPSTEVSGENYRDAEPLFEEEAEEMLARVVPNYVGGILYSAICESVASESGARRAAMNAANKNASEMIDALMLKYNRARQAVITQEITEIVSGAEAL